MCRLIRVFLVSVPLPFALFLVPPAFAQTWISAVTATTTATSATISWTTAVPANSQITYIFAGPSDFIPTRYWDSPALRNAKPAGRLGNLFIFRGTFNLPAQAASEFYWRGIKRIYGGNPSDIEAEEAFRRSVELDPTAYFVYIQLGNLYLKSRSREKCIRAYSEALRYAPEYPEIRSALKNQVQLVSREDLAKVNPLRDPHME